VIELANALPQIISTITSTLSGRIPDILKAGISIFKAIIEAIPEILPELIKEIPTIITAIVDGLGEGISSVFDLGQDIVRGLWDGIKDMGGWISEKLAGFGESVLGSIKDFFGIKSPSRVMADVVGKNLALGIGTGFEDEIDDVNDKITGSVSAITSGGVSPYINSANAPVGKNVTINQTNNYSQAHNRYELCQSRKDVAAAVRLAMK
jgi:phage-related protein